MAGGGRPRHALRFSCEVHHDLLVRNYLTSLGTHPRPAHNSSRGLPALKPIGASFKQPDPIMNSTLLCQTASQRDA